MQTINARLKECRHVAEQYQGINHGHQDAHCGKCGQYLACVTDLVIFTSGWRFDADTWRPTKDHRDRRRRDKRLIADQHGDERERQQARERLRENAYGRTGRNRRQRTNVFNPVAGAYVGVTRDMQRWYEEAGMEATQLPVRIECPDCQADNLIDNA